MTRCWIWTLPSWTCARDLNRPCSDRNTSRAIGETICAISAGKTISAALVCSARRRASLASRPMRLACNCCSSARWRASSSRSSGSSRATRSPSALSRVLRMPPSRWLTVLRLLSTATRPGATAALSSRAVTAQAPKPPKPTPIAATPASTRLRRLGMRSSGISGSSCTVSECSGRLIRERPVMPSPREPGPEHWRQVRARPVRRV